MATFAVLGAGGVGGLLAAALTRAGHEVTVVAREPTAELIAREGLRVHSVRLGDFEARPAATAELRAPVDNLVIAVKAPGLGAALERIHVEPSLVVPLLNGVEHMEPLRARFGHAAVAATIRVVSHRAEGNLIEQTSPFLQVEAAAHQAARLPLERFVHALREAEVPAQIRDSEAEVLWSKLVRLCAMALTTAASGEPLGFVRTHPVWRVMLSGAVEEAATVAGAEGAVIDPRPVIDSFDEDPDSLTTSLARDVAAHAPDDELDAIAGAVIRTGARHGLRTPVIERLAEMVRERQVR